MCVSVLTWKKMAFPSTLQKLVTGYPLCPRQGSSSSVALQLGHSFSAMERGQKKHPGGVGGGLVLDSLTLLFLPGLVADGRAQLQPGAVRQAAAAGADHHPQAGLLQDLAVVVVGVPHGPPGQVPLSVLVFSWEHTGH